MRIIRTILFGLVTLLATSVGAQRRPVVFQSTVSQTALLELFTSEGCSSCPPAETWLSSLKESSELWKEVVPVAFHVDYWDRLGWRDPWSSKAFSDRQRAYATLWGSTTVYTPGFVLNGEECRAWSELKTRLQARRPQAGRLKIVSPDLNAWHIRFMPLAGSEASYEAHAALLASGLTSEVKAGENRGRSLKHDFVVIATVKCPLRTGSGVAWGQFELSKEARNHPGRLALAVWVTRTGSMRALQAAGGWLR